MARSIRFALVLAVVGTLAIGGTVVASNDGRKVVDSPLIGIAVGGQVLAGATGGGLPWSIAKGDVQLSADGRLHLRVEGLVFASGPNAGRNTVPTGRALVSCGGQIVAMSSIVAFSVPEGDAKVNERIDLPASCAAPVVFFAGITPGGPRWFAVTGW
jgi:hypothetical protein